MPWPTYFFLLIRTKNWSSSSLSSSLDYHTHRFINYRQCDLNESSKFWFLFFPAEKKVSLLFFFLLNKQPLRFGWKENRQKKFCSMCLCDQSLFSRERERERHWEFEMTNIFKCKYPKKKWFIYIWNQGHEDFFLFHFQFIFFSS